MPAPREGSVSRGRAGKRRRVPWMRNQITLMSTFSMRAKLRSTVQRKTAVWLLCLMSAVLPSACGDSSSSIVTMAPADTPLARLSESPTLAPVQHYNPLSYVIADPGPRCHRLPPPRCHRLPPRGVTDSHRHASRPQPCSSHDGRDPSPTPGTAETDGNTLTSPPAGKHVDVPPVGQFVSVSAGAYYACGVKPDSTVVCWGANADGRASRPLGCSPPSAGVAATPAGPS